MNDESIKFDYLIKAELRKEVELFKGSLSPHPLERKFTHKPYKKQNPSTIIIVSICRQRDFSYNNHK